MRWVKREKAAQLIQAAWRVHLINKYGLMKKRKTRKKVTQKISCDYCGYEATNVDQLIDHFSENCNNQQNHENANLI